MQHGQTVIVDTGLARTNVVHPCNPSIRAMLQKLFPACGACLAPACLAPASPSVQRNWRDDAFAFDANSDLARLRQIRIYKIGRRLLSFSSTTSTALSKSSTITCAFKQEL
jgi:hypothetical protein